MKYPDGDPDLDLTVLRYDDPLLIGIVLDWAIAKATAGLPIFNMHDGTYPGNNAKLIYCSEQRAVIVDLEWKLWHEGPDSRINGRWEPTRNWAQLGPYLNKYKISTSYGSAAGSLNMASIKGLSPTKGCERMEDAIALTVVYHTFGKEIKVPTKLLEIQKMLTEDNMKYILTS
jgi:hypothetical protein